MIIQKNPEQSNEAVSIASENPACLQIASFDYPGGTVEAQQVDLTQFQGGPCRLYLDNDGSLSTELYADHYWLLAEVILPEKRYESVSLGKVDEDGNEMTTIEEAELNLTDIDVMVYPLPQVSEVE